MSEEGYTTANLGEVEIPPELQPYMAELLRLQKENAELKRLLKTAVEDLEIVYREHSCESMNGCTEICPYNFGGKDECLGEWKHADEANKLIGGNEDDG